MADDRADDVVVPAARVAPADALQPATPLFSLLRVGDLLAQRAFERSVAESFADLAASVGGGSCLSVRRDGAPVVGVGTDRVVMPASTMKLLTASVALDLLGPDHRFVTAVLAEDLRDGVAARLYLVGGGDPLLGTAGYPETEKYPPLPRTSVEELAGRVRDAGVRAVTGGVVGIDGRYDTERYPPSWSADVRAVEAGPIGPLMVDDSLVSRAPFQRAPNPGRFAAEVFTLLLAQDGLTVEGDAAAASAPGAPAERLTEVARVESAPLAEVVAEMLTTSDDNTAEMLLKEIGLRAEGEGTREAGARAVLKALLSWDVDITGAVVTDGSGLGRGNRVSCELLVEVLDHVGWASPVGQGLPIAERTGTLAGLDLFTGTGVEGVLRGKTGTLTGARALAGYYPDPAGAVYTFALVVNTAPGIDATEVAAPLWTALGRALAAAPDAPPAASPAPAPPVPVGAG